MVSLSQHITVIWCYLDYSDKVQSETKFGLLKFWS